MTDGMHRIPTTHVGSLPRPDSLVDLLLAQDSGNDFDAKELNRMAFEAVRDAVRRQVDAGIDIVSDGEMSKPSYTFYVRHRLTGISDAGDVEGDLPKRSPHLDMLEFPEVGQGVSRGSSKYTALYCVGEVSYRGEAELSQDLANFGPAVADAGAKRSFMNAASPGVLAVFIPNTHYPSEDDYVWALAEAMRVEYEGIIEAGHMLQLDCPDMAMARHGYYQNDTEAEFLARIERNVEALNHATRNIPPEAMRLHICWGNYPGPHTHDIPVTSLFPLLCKVRPQSLLFEAANPRHEHEWEDWKTANLPDDKILVPGVIDSTSNFVEHPRLVANRIRRFVDSVGADRVVAGTDCGFGTFAGAGHVYPSVTWAKFASLVEGAELALRL